MPDEITAVHFPVREHAKAFGRDSGRVCVWPRENISVKAMWEKIESVAMDVATISKVNRVLQAHNQRVRFDIYCPHDSVQALCDKLTEARECCWYVKRHVSYYDRKLAVQRLTAGDPVPAPAVREVPTGSLTVLSLNINSASNKMTELSRLNQNVGASVIMLQETFRSSTKMPLHMRGYSVFESLHRPVRGSNGLALFIKDTLHPFQLGEQSPYFVAARVTCNLVDWVFLSVYIPCKSNAVGRAAAIVDLKAVVSTLISRNLGSRIIIGGDFNMDPSKLDSMLKRWRLPLQRCPCVGNSSPVTRPGSRKWSSLDHFIMSAEAANFLSPMRVLRSWDISDHWPIQLSLSTGDPVQNVPDVEPPTQPFVIDRLKLKQNAADIVNSNYWNVLLYADAIDDEGADVGHILSRFNATAKNVLTSAGATKTGTGRVRRSGLMSSQAKRLLRLRQSRYRRWLRDEAPLRSHLWEAYQQAKSLSLAETRRSDRMAMLKDLTKVTDQVLSHNYGAFWRWTKSRAGRGRAQHRVGPLYKNFVGGELTKSDAEILQVLHEYYSSLLSDSTNLSRDREYWMQQFPGPVSAPLPRMDDSISWRELNSVLTALANGTAANPLDGLPPEFFKLASEREVDDGGEPSSLLGEVLLQLANLLLVSNNIPVEHNTAVIVSIFKDGDNKSLGNYRGISLIAVMIKIVTIVVFRRVYDGLEQRDFFRPEQAGFRTKEECPAHICALYEIIESRKLNGKPTYVAFLDIKKAYDCVPHEALLRKLEMAGVSGTCYLFVRALYATSAVRIRGNNGSLSDIILMLRGQRQGCPGSPPGFNVFVNDIYLGFHNLGVVVYSNGLEKVRVAGLLLADDTVAIAPTCKKLVRGLKTSTTWANRNHMKFGITKCGIMGFGPGSAATVASWSELFLLDGELVPVVTSYKYLGVTINSTFSLDAIVAEREMKGRKVLEAIKPLLWNIRMPVAFRVLLVKSILMPTLTWACELWGMNSSRVRPLQLLLDEACKVLLRLRKNSTVTAADTVAAEFNIPSIYAYTSGARARAYTKYSGLRTIIAVLYRHPQSVPRGKLTWVSGSLRWLQKNCPAAITLSPSEANSCVRAAVFSSHIASRSKPSETLKRAWSARYRLSSKYIVQSRVYTRDMVSINWLSRFRTYAVETTAQLRHLESRALASRLRRGHCIFCDQDVAETLPHMVVTCVAWVQLREQFEILPLIQSITNSRLAPAFPAEQVEKALFVYLLGGSSEVDDAGPVRNWILSDAQLGHRDALGLQNELPVFLKVSRYLSALVKHRSSAIKRLSESVAHPTRANAAVIGRAVPVPDRGQPLADPPEDPDARRGELH